MHLFTEKNSDVLPKVKQNGKPKKKTNYQDFKPKIYKYPESLKDTRINCILCKGLSEKYLRKRMFDPLSQFLDLLPHFP